MKNKPVVVVVAATVLFAGVTWGEESQDVDASDPTKVYSFAGPGYKRTEYSNGDSLNELRVIGNLGFGASDMVMFEVGYGKYSGTVLDGEDDTGLTNSRARYFHLFGMDYGVVRGYRGLTTQVDLQFQGDVKGTTGGNTVAVGVLPAFGLSEQWSFFLPVNYVSTWGDDFDRHQGHGASVAPLLVWSPENRPWPGFYLQIWPNYTRYFSGDLSGEGGAALDVSTGWSITPTLILGATLQQNFDKDLKFYTPATGTSGANDWNLFVNLNFYF